MWRLWLALGALLIFGVTYMAYRGGPNMEKVKRTCVAKPRSVAQGTQGAAMLLTQELVHCMREELGGKGPEEFEKRARLVDIPPPVECQFVGVWRSLRPETEYQVTLDSKRRFLAENVKGEGPATVEGSWVSEGNRITWMYDRKLVWPPDANEIRDFKGDSFSVVEVNGSLTQFELIERGDCP